MSFSVSFTARSRLHALRLLDQRSSGLPTHVLNFIKTALENLQQPNDAQQVILVEASGHVSLSSSGHSHATIKVQPIDIPD